MPSFNDSRTAAAPPEEVWKILYDPYRFPDWWAGVETVTAQAAPGADATEYTMYPTGYPDFPMPQSMRADQSEHRIVISCLVSDLRFDWTLEPLRHGTATRIRVHVDIPEGEAHRLGSQRSIIRASLALLAALAANASSCAQLSEKGG